jgi:hypothetical protein
MSESLLNATATAITDDNTGDAGDSARATAGGHDATGDTGGDDGLTWLKPEAWADLKDDKGLLLGKYKTPLELAEGYKSLTGKLRESAAPETYEAITLQGDDLPEQLKGLVVGTDDAALSVLAPVFKKHKIGQEALNDIVQTYLVAEAAARSFDPEKAKAALGSEADKVIDRLNATVGKHLKTKELELAAQELGRNPELMKLFYVALGDGDVSIPDKAAVAPVTLEGLQEAISALHKDPELGFDKYKQKRYSDLLVQRNAIKSQKQ